MHSGKITSGKHLSKSFSLNNNIRVAIIGGGPSGLLMFKRFVEGEDKKFHIEIFERQQELGKGMPYGSEGALPEHITNVSGNEIPELQTSLTKWIKGLPEETTKYYNIDPNNFNAYKVLPRLLFGEYLAAQFESLKQMALNKGIQVTIHKGMKVTDIKDFPQKDKVEIQYQGKREEFDTVIICSGHNWPKKKEKIIPGYFDSPYPPSKLELEVNYPVAIRGSSLTAIDAVRTLARKNGTFFKDEKTGMQKYKKTDELSGFEIVMHSLNGLLPAIRFHLEDSHLSKGSVLSNEEVEACRAENGGFVPLDFIFQNNFKKPLKENDIEFYRLIKDMEIEDFVQAVMNVREKIDPFELFREEYNEAEESIHNKESVHWKEMLAVLSFTMNYPAKYFCAEDMLRLKKVLMPLISVVIAFVPQSSAEEMLALQEAGVLQIIAVGDNSEVVPNPKGGAIYSYTDESGIKTESSYKLFIDCIGQPHLEAKDLPFEGLVKSKSISSAKLVFRDVEKGREEMEKNPDKIFLDAQGNYYLDVPGIAINDYFQVVNAKGEANERIYMMAVPYIGGFNPDYSGLDFSEAASTRVFEGLNQTVTKKSP